MTADLYTLSSAYSQFFNSITKKLNQGFPVGDNPYQLFRMSSINVKLIIDNLPLSILPSDPTDLCPYLLESISNETDFPFFGARFLQPVHVKRGLK